MTLKMRERLWFAVQDGDDYVRWRRATKGSASRKHLVKHDAEAEDVCALVNLKSARLFRRHVCDSAYDYPRPCVCERQRIRASVDSLLGELGETEV